MTVPSNLLYLRNLFDCSNFLLPYICKICDWSTNEKINTHICESNKIFAAPTITTCRRCGIGSYSVLWIYFHFKNCKFLGEKQFECGQCSYKAKRKFYIKIHMLTKHTPDELIKWFKCDKCSFQAKHNSNLKAHIMKRHTQVRLFLCDHCAYKTTRGDQLKKHINSRHIPDWIVQWYYCDKCDFKSKDPLGLKQHINRKHVIDRIKTLKCNQCSFYTYTNSLLSKHTWRKHFQEVEWYNCDECSFRTKYRSSLKSHKMHKHSLITKMWNCDECFFVTQTRASLKYHKRSKHLPDELIQWFTCEICAYRSKDRSNLTNHLKVKHSIGKTKFKCDECNFETYKSERFIHHQTTVHSADLNKPVKWLNCKECDYKCRFRKDMNNHAKINHSEFWFQCSNCNFKTSRNCVLNRHVLRMHTPDDQITWWCCKVCDFRTKTKTSLKRHEKFKHIYLV